MIFIKKTNNLGLDKPNRLEVPGEELNFVIHSLRNSTKYFKHLKMSLNYINHESAILNAVGCFPIIIIIIASSRTWHCP